MATSLLSPSSVDAPFSDIDKTIAIPASPDDSSVTVSVAEMAPLSVLPLPAVGIGAPATVPNDDANRPAIRPRSKRRFSERKGRVAATNRLVDDGLATGKAFVSAEGNLSPGYLRAKRAVDIAGSLVLIAVLSPVMLFVFLVLLVTTRGKPLFFQERIGYLGRPFAMFKFRTMTLDAVQRQHEVKNEQDGPIFKNRRDPRVTRIGRFLRSTSIDETPQLFNVFLGQMSLVGPRPPIAAEVTRYDARQCRRLGVKPGLTCLWQVSGRSEIGFDEWIRMDSWYIANQNLWIDLRLLVKTPWSVLSRRGAY